MTQKMDIVPLRGGLDLVTPPMLIPKGFAISCINYEPTVEGYTRMTGYERLDGRPKPSEAAYYVLDFDNGSAAISEGDTVTGATSSATGIAVIDAVVESGSYGGGDAAGYLVLYNVSGTFQDDENLQVSAATKSIANGTASLNGADNDTDDSTWIESVTSKRRAVIQKPSGSGAIRGVATYNGDIYCWRDNAGGTAGTMFKASTAGWVAQSFGSYILFDAGTAEFVEGETLTGGTSAATATIERLVQNDGAWGSSDASGYIVLSGITGTFQDNELITSASGSATANGTTVAITLPAGGAYNAIERNFYATDATTRLYFANGVGPACEWDGSVLVPILTGLSASLEKPKYIEEHRLTLFLGYATGSLQGSSPGLPTVFDAAQGAFEVGFGQSITGMKSNKDALIVTGRNKVGYLVGSDATDFELKKLSDDSGGIEATLQVVGQPMYMDDQGLRDMQAAQSFGDWLIGTKTRLVDPYIRSKKAAGSTVVGSLRVRSKDQYRLFYSDKAGFTVYFGRGDPEILPFLLLNTPTCFASGEDTSGDEILLMGDDEGWVYQIDAGTSYDGEAIEAYLRTSFMHQNMPNVVKRYHRARLEGKAAQQNSALFMTADFGYGDPNQAPSVQTDFTFYGGGAFWDEANWDEFFWDAQIEGQAFAPMDGIGENVSVIFGSNTATESAHTLSTLTINYSQRRKLR